MVRVSGIILAVLGSLGLFSAIISVFSMLEGSYDVYDLYKSIGLSGYLPYMVLWNFIASAVTLTIGIIGIKYSVRSEKAQSIIIMGIAGIVLQAAGLIISLFTFIPMFNGNALNSLYSQFDDMAIYADMFSSMFSSMFTSMIIIGFSIGAITGCILPILYIIGGSKLKKNAVSSATVSG
jgi:hypothetical protein